MLFKTLLSTSYSKIIFNKIMGGISQCITHQKHLMQMTNF